MNQPIHCAAGRSAFFGGRWRVPCENRARHSIGSPSNEPIFLCDQHFNEVASAGLVTEQNIGEAEYQRREAARLGKNRSPETPAGGR